MRSTFLHMCLCDGFLFIAYFKAQALLPVPASFFSPNPRSSQPFSSIKFIFKCSFG
jgi:hypothetical protein